MNIIITKTDDNPIYLQIEQQIQSMILRGDLKEGDALPSMRNLAKELRISMITTKRAYEDLERDGYIESYTGRGSFVKIQNMDYLQEAVRKQMEELLEQAIDKGKSIGMTKKELFDLLEMLLDESE